MRSLFCFPRFDPFTFWAFPSQRIESSSHALPDSGPLSSGSQRCLHGLPVPGHCPSAVLGKLSPPAVVAASPQLAQDSTEFISLDLTDSTTLPISRRSCDCQLCNMELRILSLRHQTKHAFSKGHTKIYYSYLWN
jgi:hypothetical protein